LHSTAITKLAPPFNRQGYMNSAILFVFKGALSLTVQRLTAAGCLSNAMAWYVLIYF